MLIDRQVVSIKVKAGVEQNWGKIKVKARNNKLAGKIISRISYRNSISIIL